MALLRVGPVGLSKFGEISRCSNGISVFRGFATSDHERNFKTVSVRGSAMNYVDTGGQSNNTVIFLHGNPTSAYLWRNIYPGISSIARCFAPDLIGMGRSDKVENLTYTFSEHYEYLSQWMEQVVTSQKVNLVVHDWGSALGFHWANQNRDRVQSITHMESVVQPFESWNEFPEGGQKIFQAMRSPAGEEIVLDKNVFVERILPSSILRKLTDEEMNEYRKPFANPNDRLPTLTWPRQIPIKGDGPADVIAAADSYSKWLAQSDSVPKLLISAEPGFFSKWIEEKTKDWPNQSRVTVRGIHFIQEDSPNEIWMAIHGFLKDKVFDQAAKL